MLKNSLPSNSLPHPPRQLYRWVIQILGPPVRMLAYVVGLPFSPLLAFYNKRWARRELSRLEQEIHDQISFLFSDYNAQTIPAVETKRLEAVDWPTVTMRIPGLLLKFVRWQGELQIYLTPEQTPDDWTELSMLLNVIDVPEKIDRRPDYKMSEAAGWLKSNLGRISAAFSGDQYADLKERLADVHKRDQLVARQWQTEINRRLYPDK